MDFISGDLDRVFTVLYEMGHVEPLLERDWKKLYRETQRRWPEVSAAIQSINKLNNLRDMRDFISGLPRDVVECLVLEVARELADFHGRTDVLH